MAVAEEVEMSSYSVTVRTSSEFQRAPDSASLSTISTASTLVGHGASASDGQRHEFSEDHVSTRFTDPASMQAPSQRDGNQNRILRYLVATWLGNAIALIASVTAIITLVLTAYSSILQIMALKWGMQNEVLQSCLAAYPISRLSAFCNVNISNGVIEPPSEIWHQGTSEVMHGGMEDYDGPMYDGPMLDGPMYDELDRAVAKEGILAAKPIRFEVDDNGGFIGIGALGVIIMTLAGIIALCVLMSRQRRPLRSLASMGVNRKPGSCAGGKL